jgi:hypothetical protein
LLRCINGPQHPSAGHIRLAGQDITVLSPAEQQKLRRRIGFFWQEFNRVERMSAFAHVLIGRLGYSPEWQTQAGYYARDQRDIALRNLERVNLLERPHQRADRLYSSEKQRVAITRAISQQPAVIVADEPVASLDPKLAWQVMGAPNALPGASHSHNLSAQDEIRAGVVDTLASDYFPAAMLTIADKGLLPLHQAAKLVSATPADAFGLHDRGALAVGELADLVLAETTGRAHRCVIGHDPWIGHAAIVTPGIKVEIGAVVGSGAIVGGVPARIIRPHFPAGVASRLLTSAWWDWGRATLELRFEELIAGGQFLKGA